MSISPGRLVRGCAAGFLLSCMIVMSAAQLGEFGVRSAMPMPVLKPEALIPRTVLERVREEGRLIVLTYNGPTTYFLDKDDPAGFEHDLASAFADHLGVEVEFRVLKSVADVLAALSAGEGHLAAGVTRTKDPRTAFLSGPAYSAVRQQLVCHRKGPRPSKARLHKASITVVTEQSYRSRMNDLKERAPALQWAANRGLTAEDLMARVAAREIDCTVGDSTLVSLTRRYHPDLIVPFDLTERENLSWMMPEDAVDLSSEVARFFALETTAQLIEGLKERYYGHVPAFDYVDLSVFRQRIGERLDGYIPAFGRAARTTGFSWRLLAAMAYQESHWDPEATSPTGVRGLMMLTRATAEEMGVADRLDAKQSIRGGARYLRRLYDRLPKAVTGDDRLWLALAAYNVGYGHLLDARKLARGKGLNPNRWADLKTVLPLLSDPAYYKTLTYGYARGREPVGYVARVRHYWDILKRSGPAEA